MTMRSWRVALAILCWLPIAWSASARADAPEVNATRLSFSVTVKDSIGATRSAFLSSLEERNFTLVNELNVQLGLKNRGIEVRPTLLIEFINLSKAYHVAESNRGFELFAPLRAALFEEKDGGTTIMVMRPLFIKDTLSPDGLSSDGIGVLDEFDADMSAILKNVAAGGF